MNTYTSIEALELLIQGKRLRRKGWGHDYAMIARNTVDGVTHSHIQHVIDRKGVMHTSELYMRELLSNDWEIAPNEMPCHCCKTIVKRW